MKLKLFIKYVIILLLFSFHNLFANEFHKISLQYPSGGEIYTSGHTCQITWESNTFGEYINVYLWDGCSSSWTLLEDSIDIALESYLWLISPMLIGDRFRIKITLSGNENIYSGNSAYITIINEQEQFPNIVIQPIFTDSTQIFPNPSNEVIYIKNNEYFIKSVELYDLNGIKVITWHGSAFVVKLIINDLPNGSYFVLYQTNNNNLLSKKIVILK